MKRASASRRGVASVAASQALNTTTLRAARLAMIAAAGLAAVGSAFGLLFGVPAGAIAGFGIWLVVASLVFSLVILMPMITWPVERLAPIGMAATTFFGAYLAALAVYAVLDPGSHDTLFVGLIWFTPLQAFNRIVNRGRTAWLLAWLLVATPPLILGLLSPWIVRIFPPPLVAIAIVCVLAHVTSALMINVLWRYREAFESEGEMSASFRFASEILETVSESFILVDRAFRLLYLNRSACLAMDVARSEAEGKPLARVGGRIAWSAFTNALEAAWSGAGPERFEVEAAARWYEVRSTPGSTDMAVLFQDITDQRATR